MPAWPLNGRFAEPVGAIDFVQVEALANGGEIGEREAEN